MKPRTLSELLDALPATKPASCRESVKVNGALFPCRGGHGARSRQHVSVFNEQGICITVRWSTDAIVQRAKENR
jgi:hypothetical protein